MSLENDIDSVRECKDDLREGEKKILPRKQLDKTGRSLQSLNGQRKKLGKKGKLMAQMTKRGSMKFIFSDLQNYVIVALN